MILMKMMMITHIGPAEEILLVRTTQRILIQMNSLRLMMKREVNKKAWKMTKKMVAEGHPVLWRMSMSQL
jgi:hypothetical protein